MKEITPRVRDMPRRATTRLLVALLLRCGAAVSTPARSSVVQEDGRAGATSAVDGATRPDRGGSSIFDAPTAEDGAPTAEWRAATEGILSDMRAHLERRKTDADADVIRSRRGPIFQAILGVHDFLRSKARGRRQWHALPGGSCMCCPGAAGPR